MDIKSTISLYYTFRHLKRRLKNMRFKNMILFIIINMSKFYVLEVIRFITEKDGENGWLNKGSKLEHVGYMKVKFRTKKDACSYYKKCNPHMRELNAHGDYESDWDPNTKLMYIVRKYYGIYVNSSICR